MDVWVFAAAASAGYMAQHLKNLNISNRNWPNFSYDILKSGRVGPSASLQKAFEKGIPLQKEEIFLQKELDSDDAEELASTSGFEGQEPLKRDAVCDSDSSCGLEKNILDSKEVTYDAIELKASGSSSRPSIIEIGFLLGSKQLKGSLRCRCFTLEYVKPKNVLENCLLAQLWNGDSRIEEHSRFTNASWREILHTLPVTECRIINRPVAEWCCETKAAEKNDFRNEKCLEPIKSAHTIPTLPNVAAVKSQVKARNKKNQALTKGNVEKSAGDLENKEAGSSNDLLLFNLGLKIGILYTSSVNLWEMEKLKKSLKQTENLVQDLHDELEMKDSLTVRELTTRNELWDSCNVCIDDISTSTNYEQIEDSSRYSSEVHCHQNPDEESFLKIEAELEAELDRLQFNTNSLQPESNVSNFDEPSPDFVPDIAEGELRAECFSRKSESSYYSEKCRSSVPTPCSNQYPVSPRLLTVKLHEVIQSRLKERIKQLESMIKFPDSKYIPVESVEQPVVIHLHGESLASYNETYEEEYETEDALFLEETREVGFSVNAEDHAVLMNESENVEDEMERLLIEKIVEKARQGSPAILKANWALLSE